MKKIPKNSNRVKFERLVRSRFRKLVKNCFEGIYEYCFQSGSVAYGGGTLGKSDIDLIVVFKNNIYTLSKKELIKRIESFIDGYLELHKQTGFFPDLVFPGEFITVIMINDSIKGRGFQLDSNGSLYLPKASTQYYLEDPERWFRAWLSQSAFNRFLIGNKELFKKNKIEAWSTILKFTLWNEKIDSFTSSDIFNQLRSFGVHSDYFNFKGMEEGWVNKCLIQLKKQGFISKNKNIYTTHYQKLISWENQVSGSIKTGSVKKTKLLLNLKETLSIAKYTTQKWNKMQTG